MIQFDKIKKRIGSKIKQKQEQNKVFSNDHIDNQVDESNVRKYLENERKKDTSDNFIIREYTHKVILFGYITVNSYLAK